MALIPSKARTGIAALTFAAAMAPFVLATPAKAIAIGFFDGPPDEPEGGVRNGARYVCAAVTPKR